MLLGVECVTGQEEGMGLSGSCPGTVQRSLNGYMQALSVSMIFAVWILYF